MNFDEVIFDKGIFDKGIFDKGIFDKVIFGKVIFDIVIFDIVSFDKVINSLSALAASSWPQVFIGKSVWTSTVYSTGLVPRNDQKEIGILEKIETNLTR
jgi:hypothetical protein